MIARYVTCIYAFRCLLITLQCIGHISVAACSCTWIELDILGRILSAHFSISLSLQHRHPPYCKYNKCLAVLVQINLSDFSLSTCYPLGRVRCFNTVFLSCQQQQAMYPLYILDIHRMRTTWLCMIYKCTYVLLQLEMNMWSTLLLLSTHPSVSFIAWMILCILLCDTDRCIP